jgi:hypothetical protein
MADMGHSGTIFLGIPSLGEYVSTIKTKYNYSHIYIYDGGGERERDIDIIHNQLCVCDRYICYCGRPHNKAPNMLQCLMVAAGIRHGAGSTD